MIIAVSNLLRAVPITIDPSAWYFRGTVIVLLILAGLTIWSFRATLAGRPAFAALDPDD